MESQITMLISPLPGLRLLGGDAEPEQGSVIAFRKNGDEALFASWNDEEGQEKGLAWIPVGEFSVNPDSVTPPEILEEEPQPGDEPQEDQPTTQRKGRGGPFGGLPRREVKGD
jgi:hypothetical protein